MSCYYYHIGPKDNDWVRFGEDQDIGCTCTFPINDRVYGINKDRVFELALLGAAVAMYYNQELELPAYIPESIPDWITDQIKKSIYD